MLGNFLIEDKAQLEPPRQNLYGVTDSRRLSGKREFFQVNSEFRRYWSGNTVLIGEEVIFELRFCPNCHDVIEHDERGYPHCLTCGHIFPWPRSSIPKTEEEEEQARANNAACHNRWIKKELKRLGHGKRTSNPEAFGESDSIGRPRKTTRDCHRVVHKASKSK